MTAGERAAVIDEYGELTRQIAETKPLRDRALQLAQQIQGWYEAEDAQEAYVAEGKAYSVQVSARANERKVTNMSRLYRLLGQKRFVEAATITLKAIDACVPKVRHGEFLTEERTGRRILTPVAKVSSPAHVFDGRKKVAA